ncbi:hypothetical protein CU044_1853 [Streptomyces sp. L-9-10]|nr:hypothetical protein CU044_1853 [Streptomyces sp. L-9-10]
MGTGGHHRPSGGWGTRSRGPAVIRGHPRGPVRIRTYRP